MDKTWYLYMVRCADDSLYTGVALDVGRRFAQHCSQKTPCARYLRGKAPLSLVYVMVAGNHSEALRLELRVKRLGRPAKERLIRGNYPLGQLFATAADEKVEKIND
jgi:putative endonuclease